MMEQSESYRSKVARMLLSAFTMICYSNTNKIASCLSGKKVQKKKKCPYGDFNFHWYIHYTFGFDQHKWDKSKETDKSK